MLNFITDQLPGEPDLFTTGKHLDLEIRSLAGNVLAKVTAPASGWTHEQLSAVAPEQEAVTRDGADGYLGGQWLGSTEV